MPYVLLLFENAQVIGHRINWELCSQIKFTVFIDSRKDAKRGGGERVVCVLYNTITLLHCLTHLYFWCCPWDIASTEGWYRGSFVVFFSLGGRHKQQWWWKGRWRGRYALRRFQPPTGFIPRWFCRNVYGIRWTESGSGIYINVQAWWWLLHCLTHFYFWCCPWDIASTERQYRDRFIMFYSVGRKNKRQCSIR